MLEMSFSEVAEFVAMQRRTGRYNRNTATARQAACARIETVLPRGATVGYVKEHLVELIAKYGALHPDVAVASLGNYRSRIARSIEDYLAHQVDPNWTPRTRVTNHSFLLPAMVPTSAVGSTEKSPPAAGGALRHRYPLRADFDVEIVLPRDLTILEAKRLTAWISTFAAGEGIE